MKARGGGLIWDQVPVPRRGGHGRAIRLHIPQSISACKGFFNFRTQDIICDMACDMICYYSTWWNNKKLSSFGSPLFLPSNRLEIVVAWVRFYVINPHIWEFVAKFACFVVVNPTPHFESFSPRDLSLILDVRNILLLYFFFGEYILDPSPNLFEICWSVWSAHLL